LLFFSVSYFCFFRQSLFYFYDAFYCLFFLFLLFFEVAVTDGIEEVGPIFIVFVLASTSRLPHAATFFITTV